jgi:hypothetical protein
VGQPESEADLGALPARGDSGSALSVLDGAAADGAQIVQRPYTGALDQQWRLVKVGSANVRWGPVVEDVATH